MLKLVLNVASGLVVYPKVIAATIKAELPFMVTEDVLMAAVAAGGDRQALHERIRRHAQAAARRVKLEGAGNDLMDRLSTDDAFAGLEVGKLLATQRYVGRAPQQVDAFLRDVVTQIRRRHRQRLGRVATLSV
jgi:adenylosuccinate lyase